LGDATTFYTADQKRRACGRIDRGVERWVIIVQHRRGSRAEVPRHHGGDMNPRRRQHARIRRSQRRWLVKLAAFEAELPPGSLYRTVLPRKADGRIDWAALHRYYVDKTGKCSFSVSASRPWRVKLISARIQWPSAFSLDPVYVTRTSIAGASNGVDLAIDGLVPSADRSSYRYEIE
jgi:hypothetical protein